MGSEDNTFYVTNITFLDKPVGWMNQRKHPWVNESKDK